MEMTKRNPLPLLAALCVCLLLGITGASAATYADISYPADVRTEGALIHPQLVEETAYLFLPSSAELTDLTLRFGEEGEEATLAAGKNSMTVFSGQAFSLGELYPTLEAGVTYPVTLTLGEDVISLSLIKSDRVAALFLNSADPEKGRAWVEEVKSNKAKGSAVLQSPEGALLYDGELKQIKGRGNSTWYNPKKPYQIKLKEKTDLLEIGEPAGTWVLLANYLDKSLLRNTITYDLATELKLPYSPHGRPVDLYYDGEYRGSYLLSEKTEIGSNRVDIHNLEEDIETVNPDVEDFDDLQTVLGVTPTEKVCQYVTGLNLPERLEGGYLLEVDFPDRAKEEKSWFNSELLTLVSKSPEYLPKEAIDYISVAWQTFEDAVIAGGTNPETGLTYDNYIDVPSLARYYLLEELSQDVDVFQSSSFFYKRDDDTRFFAGPIWDFDLSYNTGEMPINVLAAGSSALGARLLSIHHFRQAVQDSYAVLNPMVWDILLSEDPSVHGKTLRSLASYMEEVSVSRELDVILWPDAEHESFADAVGELRAFLAERNQWLYNEVMGWTEDMKMTVRFADVPETAWYAGAVYDVVERGLFGGTTAILFSPHKTMTRAMTVVVLHRLAGKPEAAAEANFTDVASGSWCMDAVSWATEKGIVTGYPDATFRPNEPVNRQELVSLFFRYAEFSGLNPVPHEIPEVFTDRDSVPKWARDAFGWAIYQGLVNGMNDDSLNPKGSAPRSQGATLFQRYCLMLENPVPEPEPDPADDPNPEEPQETDPKTEEPQETDPKAEEPQETDPNAEEPQETDPKADEGKDTDTKAEDTEDPDAKPDDGKESDDKGDEAKDPGTKDDGKAPDDKADETKDPDAKPEDTKDAEAGAGDTEKTDADAEENPSDAADQTSEPAETDKETEA